VDEKERKYMKIRMLFNKTNMGTSIGEFTIVDDSAINEKFAESFIGKQVRYKDEKVGEIIDAKYKKELGEIMATAELDLEKLPDTFKDDMTRIGVDVSECSLTKEKRCHDCIHFSMCVFQSQIEECSKALSHVSTSYDKLRKWVYSFADNCNFFEEVT
jgi:hypothetical protein